MLLNKREDQLSLTLEGAIDPQDLERLGIKERNDPMMGKRDKTGYINMGLTRGYIVSGDAEVTALANAGVNFPGADKIRTEAAKWASRASGQSHSH